MNEDVLAEIIRETTPYFRQPGDFTVSEYIARFEAETGHKVTTGFADRALGKLVDQGILQRVEHVYDPQSSRRCVVYRKAKQDGKEPELYGIQPEREEL